MSLHATRIERARARMREVGVDALLLSTGADLPYLTGYEAMPLERLTMLVVTIDGAAELVIPRLEAPRVDAREGAFTVHPWEETQDPIALVVALLAGARNVAIGDQTWARFLVELHDVDPQLAFRRAIEVTGPLRVVKDAAEIDALRAAAHAVDEIAATMRERPFGGRRELDVHRELVDRMLDAGHQRANFAIVATGDNAASPHHDPSERVIEAGDVVLCDFGGTMHGYCSDITRMFSVGEPAAEVREAYAVLVDAQEAGVQAATVGTRCEDVDAAARRVIDAAGYGEYFVHRTGHGIGAEAHEDPYVVSGNATPVEPGHAFSVEPGIYVPGRFGLRLEDIVVATADGPDRLNRAARDLAVVASRAPRSPRMAFDLSTLLLQWAAGGLLFCWVTTRRREVGLGYGWLLRIVYGALAAGSLLAGLGDTGAGAAVRNAGAALVVLAALVALAVSVRGRARGLDGFDPRLDLVAPVVGLGALAGAASFVGGDYPLSLARLLVGAVFLGAVTDGMLLGHWYLVQPGLRHDPIKEIVRIVGVVWPLEVVVWLVPPGMVSVLDGSVDDGYGGLIGWMWVLASLTTIGLVIATWKALEEPSYSAVMAATGLMYLAILTGFGMDLLPRALLS